MKKIKLYLGIFFILLSGKIFSQNGLEGIIVEKYYVSNAADSVGSIGTLPVGSVTYRIFVDLLPGYEFQAAYGVPGHALVLSTTTSFFNNEDRGATTPTYTKTQARGNTVMLDSWLSVGAGCAANLGILKSEDDVALGGATVVNNSVPAILQNNDPSAGIPLTTHDGLYTATIQPVTFVGITGADLALFDATSQVGNMFTTSNGSWASLNGSTGPTSANKVLIAQMTTNGAFHYELNIQIGTPSGGVENYVASNPVGSEIQLAALSGTIGGANASPAVNITSPANNSSFITGAIIQLNANASDPDGTVASVEFFVDGVSVGTDNSSPYSVNYTGVLGSHQVTAVATDNLGAQTTSTAITIDVTNNPPPSVNITSPSNGSSFITGAIVNITANAADNGSVASVEFFVDGISIGVDNSSPYTASYTGTSGSHSLTATATDNLGAQNTSAAILISVGSNPPPSVSITSPVNGALVIAPAVVTIEADASDNNGTVTQVQFYVNGNLVGVDNSAPYSFDWTSVIGSAGITAKATDDLGAQTTSSVVTISVADPNIPYKILTSSNNCTSGNFCLPITAISAVNNVIGYDMTVQYNNAKVRPTGVVTISPDLIHPAYVDIASSTDTVNGIINLSLFFNTTAPANTEFSGIGELLCIEFAKRNAFNPVDTASFSVSFFQESYISGTALKTVDAGKYISYRDSLFNGTLKFWSDNSPIKYNSSNPGAYLITNVFGNNNVCSSPSVVAVQPDTTGNFYFSITNGQYINISRDIPGTSSVQPVVNGFDALMTRKVLINDPSFVPSIYQMIAMDVNTDGVISAGDASQINQRAVLMIPEYKQSWNYDSNGVSNGQLSKDWLFIDSMTVANNPGYRVSLTYPADDGIGFWKGDVPVIPFCLPLSIININTCPDITGQTYKGVLLGDVDGNFSSVVSNGLFRTTRGKIIFDLNEAESDEGYIDVPVSFISDEPVHAMDFSLGLNDIASLYHSAERNSNIQMTSYLNNDDKFLRVTSNSFQEYIPGIKIMSVRFRSSLENFDESKFNSSEGFLNGSPVEIEFRKSTVTPGKTNNVRVYPNPVRGLMSIEVSEDCIGELLTVDGRSLTGIIRLSAGETSRLNTGNLSGGIYFLRIYGGEETIVKKIVIEN